VISREVFETNRLRFFFRDPFHCLAAKARRADYLAARSGDRAAISLIRLSAALF